MPEINFAEMFIWYAAFLFSVTAHEAAHAFVAMKGGDLTAYQGGQVTLNPIPHITRSPFGTVVVPLISFFLGGWMIGWASAPYDPSWAQKYPRRAAWMAAAGPAANFIIVVVTFIIIKIGLAGSTFVAPNADELRLSTIVMAQSGIWSGLAKLLSILFILNLILFIFNLFPVPPLDGSGVITLFMPPETARRFNAFLRQPMYAMLGIVIAWRLFGRVFREIFVFAFNLIHPNSTVF